MNAMQFRWVHINLTTSTIETSMWVNLGNVREIYTFQSSLSSNYGQFMDTFYQIYSEILPNYLPGKISFYNFTSSSPHIAQQRMENGRMPVTINLKNNNKDILLLYIDILDNTISNIRYWTCGGPSISILLPGYQSWSRVFIN